MKITRRQFNIFASLNILSLSLKAQAKSKSTGPYSGAFVLQGATDHNSTLFSVVTSKVDDAKFSIVENETGRIFSAHEERVMERTFAPWRVHNLYVVGLNLAYTYKLLVANGQGDVIDERNFNALRHSKENQAFALGSCMLDHKHRASIWQKLQEKKPAALLLMGDMVYGDKPNKNTVQPADEVQLWQRYCESRTTLELYRFKDLIPTFSTWDDHDIGLNNCDRQWNMVGEAKVLFDFFNPCDERCSLVTSGPGVAKKVKLFGQDFIFLDGRSFRSEQGALDETLYGLEQELWLLQNIDSSRTTWLLNGTQWSTPYNRLETYATSHPISYNNLMTTLSLTGGKFVFCSGDVHFSEVTKVVHNSLPYETLEFTASSFHSTFVPGMERFLGNPQRLASKSARNFFMVNCENKNDSLIGSVECVSTRDKSIFSVDFELFGEEKGRYKVSGTGPAEK